jgi:hypothetical protein
MSRAERAQIASKGITRAIVAHASAWTRTRGVARWRSSSGVQRR